VVTLRIRRGGGVRGPSGRFPIRWIRADSAELAQKWNLPLLVKPAFKRGGGTWVGRALESRVAER
jgi:hypothetical protein